MEEEAARKREILQDSQAGTELKAEIKEEKSPWQSIAEEAVLSTSTAQEANGEEKPQRSHTLETQPRVLQGGKRPPVPGRRPEIQPELRAGGEASRGGQVP